MTLRAQPQANPTLPKPSITSPRSTTSILASPATPIRPTSARPPLQSLSYGASASAHQQQSIATRNDDFSIVGSVEDPNASPSTGLYFENREYTFRTRDDRQILFIAKMRPQRYDDSDLDNVSYDVLHPYGKWYELTQGYTVDARPALDINPAEESDDEHPDFDTDGGPIFEMGVEYQFRTLDKQPIWYLGTLTSLDDWDDRHKYVSYEIRHPSGEWYNLPDGYRPTEPPRGAYPDLDDLRDVPDNVPPPHVDVRKVYVFHHEIETGGELFYAGSLTEGQQDEYDERTLFTSFNHQGWYLIPDGYRAARNVTCEGLVEHEKRFSSAHPDVSSDSGSSYGETSRTARYQKAVNAARRNRSPEPGTSDEDQELDATLEVECEAEELEGTSRPRLDKGKGRAVEPQGSDEDDQDRSDEDYDGASDPHRGFKRHRASASVNNDDLDAENEGPDADYVSTHGQKRRRLSVMQVDEDDGDDEQAVDGGDDQASGESVDENAGPSRRPKSGRYTNAENEAYRKFGLRVSAAADQLVEKYGRTKQRVMEKSGLTVAPGRRTNAFNLAKRWFALCGDGLESMWFSFFTTNHNELIPSCCSQG